MPISLEQFLEELETMHIQGNGEFDLDTDFRRARLIEILYDRFPDKRLIISQPYLCHVQIRRVS